MGSKEPGQSREDIDVPLVDIAVVPDADYEASRKDGRGTTADEVLIDSLHCLFEIHLSSSSLNHLVFRDITDLPQFTVKPLGLLKPGELLPNLRPFDMLMHLCFEHCTSHFVNSIYQEAKHCSSPNSKHLLTLIFSKMTLDVKPLQELCKNVSWLGDNVTLSIAHCHLKADSEGDALKVVESLYGAGGVNTSVGHIRSLGQH